MKKQTLVVVSVVALIATVIAWNTLGAEALPIMDEEVGTPLVQERVAPEDKPLVMPPISISLWPRPQVSGASTGGLLHQMDDEQRGLNGISLVPEATNTPASPLPAPTNTPAAPVGDAAVAVEQLPSTVGVMTASRPAGASPPIAETRVIGEDNVRRSLRRASDLQRASMHLQVTDQRARPVTQVLTQATSEETCVNVIWNSEMDVVEFGDGTGSVEYWSFLFRWIYFDNEIYNSPSHSLVMIDEADGSDPDLLNIEGQDWDYDEFGQSFQAPDSLTYLRISYSRLYGDANPNDIVWSNLWTLDSEGYLDKLIDYVPIGESPEGWSNRYWELETSKLPEASGKTLAVVFDMLSDMTVPSEVVWLDDVQVTLCYAGGTYGVYLPLVRKGRLPSPQPICSPREPDSLSQPGSTTVDVTCGGSFSPVDQKDYYTLNLDGANRVRLGLLNVPEDTNWDALIYENSSGYPLACQIGDPGDQDRWKNCPNIDGYSNTLDPGKDYFVLVSRGPNTTGGSYDMRVERR